MPVDSRVDAPELLEAHRPALTGYCYRMLGSGLEAEDAVQETMLRAWKAGDGFEGRASVRSWLYRIATNVCIDMLRSPQRRARPMDLGPAGTPVESSLGPPLAEATWVSPVADRRVLPSHADPGDIAEARETIRLAFVAALQWLPARQRAVLILCDVLRWTPAEVADLLDTSVAAVNSARQRARGTLGPDCTGPDTGGPRTTGSRTTGSRNTGSRNTASLGPDQRELLARYVDAFERFDVDLLVSLLHEDAVQSMPPFALWLRGPTDIRRWFLGPGAECRGSLLVPTEANGGAAFGQYRIDPAGGHSAWALIVVEVTADRISGMHSFLDVGPLFPLFDLPDHVGT